LNIPAIDLGVPLLSMHSPFEAAAKTDIYMAHRAFAAFFRR
jgi:aspartyl aminopeptidase